MDKPLCNTSLPNNRTLRHLFTNKAHSDEKVVECETRMEVHFQ